MTDFPSPETTPDAIPAPPPEIAPPAPAEHARHAQPARPSRFWPLLSLLLLVAVLALAAGEAGLYRLYKTRPDLSGAVAALQTAVAALQQQPQQTAAPAPATPAPPPPVAAAPSPTVIIPPGFAAQLDALQSQISADHAALATLQTAAIDTGKLQAELGAIQTETTLDHQVVAGLQTSVTDLTKQTAQLASLDRVAAAARALDAGQPLGPLPNAPPALAQYATTPPPMEAALRLSYPDAARGAANASVGGAKHGYWKNVKSRLENLVTISNGSHVIIGAPAAALLAQAQARLDAGDLAGAVTLLDTAPAPAQQAMATWLTQARALLAARAALAAMAPQ